MRLLITAIVVYALATQGGLIFTLRLGYVTLSVTPVATPEGQSVTETINRIASRLPDIGADMLLVPNRRHVGLPPPGSCEEADFIRLDVKLKGWRCNASTARRGTLIYLHGIGSNRTAGLDVIERFTRRGFDVIAYDGRAHGESGGDVSTYGFYEKKDVARVIDGLPSGENIVLIGTSFGAAVALQAAADDDRIKTLVAAESFADLRTIAHHRAPPYFVSPLIEEAFRVAEKRAGFTVDGVNVVESAARIRIPTLLIHGSADVDTPPEHSQRILEALTGPKRLIVVPGAHHNESLGGDTWLAIENWIDNVIAK